MRRRDERGASLLIAIVLLLFLSAIVPAVVGLGLVGARTNQTAGQDRSDLYTATSALESAIQYGRVTQWVGRFGAPCPGITTQVGGSTGIVTCTAATGPFDLDRRVTFTASVAGQVAAEAEVVYRDGTAAGGTPAVDVVAFDTRVADPT